MTTSKRLARRAACFFGDLQTRSAILSALFGLLTCICVFCGLYAACAATAALCVLCCGNPWGQIAGLCDEWGWES